MDSYPEKHKNKRGLPIRVAAIQQKGNNKTKRWRWALHKRWDLSASEWIKEDNKNSWIVVTIIKIDSIKIWRQYYIIRRDNKADG